MNKKNQNDLNRKIEEAQKESAREIASAEYPFAALPDEIVKEKDQAVAIESLNTELSEVRKQKKARKNRKP